MPPLRLLVAGLLALGSAVDAKEKDRLMFSKFFGNDCNGHPDGKKIELKKNECKDLAADGIRIHPHNKKKYNDWVRKVNNGEQTCQITLYKGPGCNEEFVDDSLPAVFGDHCFKTSGPLSSIDFTCEPSGFEDKAYNATLVQPLTSYSVGPDGRAHGTPYEKVITTTHYSYATTPLHARAEPTGNATLQPRSKKQHNVLGLWMRHPFVRSAICYKCWTKKELDFGSLMCRSGPKYPVDCGPMPAEKTQSYTDHVTSTRTVELWFTTTHLFATTTTTTSTATPTLKARSSHTPVVLANPYIPDKFMCADAEWENEGKVKAEVRLQHFSRMGEHSKCWKKGFVPLNIDRHPANVATDVLYTTVTKTWSTRPTWATEAH